MPKTKIWPDPPSVMNFKLYLFIQGVKHLPVGKGEGFGTSKFSVQIEWRGGSGRTGLLSKRFERNYTSKRLMQERGAISWNEGFDHACKLKRTKSNNYSSWIIHLEIQEINENMRGNLPVVGKAKVDVANFAPPENEKNIKVPIECNIRGHSVEAELKIKLQFFELQTSNSTAFSLQRALSLRSFSCTSRQHNHTNNRYPESVLSGSEENSFSSDTDPSLHYGKPATTNLFLISQSESKLDDNQHLEQFHFQQPLDQSKQQQQPSLGRLLSRDRSKRNSKGVNKTKGPPLLNKAFHENGGDRIDNDQRKQSVVPLLDPSDEKKLQPPESSDQSSKFQDENRFEVGKWEKKRIASRDGQMEIVTDVFFASIDQRSEKASGGSACTVLAAVVAHWLHDNPESLPPRCKFDDLIREGSLEWRKLCEDESHREKFLDQHFDLETVLESKVRSLSIVTEMSYVGFFSINGMSDNFEFLQGVMSFDTIWDELVSIDATGTYIVSWNDHFFVLKVESEAIYLIDTLGERLFEGCHEAYILKFDKKSAIYRRAEPVCQTKDSNKCKTKDLDEDHHEASCEGTDCCKMYIKEFLAALPLREIHHDIERGSAKEATLHRRLQIEFHYTVPCNS
ncbi:uncharacterized protein M6B38_148165 [Iris pallida]|uniref:C2 NT-type domain-containing protein n=1 Tax=Iris pallida TaxID=29817 RepID=A0AAX6F8Q2_IRIPA|nr:uncharacterized protein M6B38_148165 [Iris pallida]